MAKAHRTYRYSWWKNKFQQNRMFRPVTVTRFGSEVSNDVITKEENTDDYAWTIPELYKMQDQIDEQGYIPSIEIGKSKGPGLEPPNDDDTEGGMEYLQAQGYSWEEALDAIYGDITNNAEEDPFGYPLHISIRESNRRWFIRKRLEDMNDIDLSDLSLEEDLDLRYEDLDLSSAV